MEFKIPKKKNERDNVGLRDEMKLIGLHSKQSILFKMRHKITTIEDCCESQIFDDFPEVNHHKSIDYENRKQNYRDLLNDTNNQTHKVSHI